MTCGHLNSHPFPGTKQCTWRPLQKKTNKQASKQKPYEVATWLSKWEKKNETLISRAKLPSLFSSFPNGKTNILETMKFLDLSDECGRAFPPDGDFPTQATLCSWQRGSSMRSQPWLRFHRQLRRDSELKRSHVTYLRHEDIKDVPGPPHCSPGNKMINKILFTACP